MQSLQEEAKEAFTKLQAQYEVILKGESAERKDFAHKCETLSFDYFNIINKEYVMAQDKWGTEPGHK